MGENLWRSLHQFSSICHLCILGFSSVLGFNVKFICVIYILSVKIYHYIITHEELLVWEWEGKWKTFILLYFLSTIFQRSENMYFFCSAIFHWKVDENFSQQVRIAFFEIREHFMNLSINVSNNYEVLPQTTTLVESASYSQIVQPNELFLDDFRFPSMLKIFSIANYFLK